MLNNIDCARHIYSQKLTLQICEFPHWVFCTFGEAIAVVRRSTHFWQPKLLSSNVQSLAIGYLCTVLRYSRKSRCTDSYTSMSTNLSNFINQFECKWNLTHCSNLLGQYIFWYQEMKSPRPTSSGERLLVNRPHIVNALWIEHDNV